MSDGGSAVERAKQALEGVTPGPWTWNSYRVPGLEGRGGDPETCEYDTEVLEANHNGECGCRSACGLELNIGDADKAFIAAARQLVPELIAEVERTNAELMFARDGMEIRPMTEVESNLMTQVLGLRREREQLRAEVARLEKVQRAMGGQLDPWLRGHPMTAERRLDVSSLIQEKR